MDAVVGARTKDRVTQILSSQDGFSTRYVYGNRDRRSIYIESVHLIACANCQHFTVFGRVYIPGAWLSARQQILIDVDI